MWQSTAFIHMFAQSVFKKCFQVICFSFTASAFTRTADLENRQKIQTNAAAVHTPQRLKHSSIIVHTFFTISFPLCNVFFFFFSPNLNNNNNNKIILHSKIYKWMQYTERERWTRSKSWQLFHALYVRAEPYIWRVNSFIWPSSTVRLRKKTPIVDAEEAKG